MDVLGSRPMTGESVPAWARRVAKHGRQPKLNPGTIYIVKCAHAGEQWFKIGITTKGLTPRLSSIQTGCPLPISTVVTVRVDGPRKLERQLHDLFAAARVSGEWFSLKPEQLSQAVAMLNAARLPAGESA